MKTILELERITRRFGGVVALDEVSFDLCAGEVHALVGENGAGKSTLINILSGVLQPSEGRIVLDGQGVELSNPLTARGHGIVTVFQESDLFGTLSVAENMALTQGLPASPLGFVQWKQVNAAATDAVAHLTEEIDVHAPAATLSIAERHMTQIAAAVAKPSRVVLLDEPTSSLSLLESEWLFEQIERLRQSGVGVIYISHRQEEIFRLADRITVLRDGKRVWHGRAVETDRAGLVRAMVGRETKVARTAPRMPSADPLLVPRARVVFESVGRTDAKGEYQSIDLILRPGEVVGIYGLVGSGRSEWAQGVFGLRKASAGHVRLGGDEIVIRAPADAVRAGIAYLPEDRLRQGVFRGLSVKANGAIASLIRWSRGPFVGLNAEKTAVSNAATDLCVRMRSVEQPMAELSGGNQQKIVLARWMLAEPKVLLLDEPTRGIDVAAKEEIHRWIRGLAEQGCAIALISSELPEILERSDRIVVFREGRVSAEFAGGVVTPEEVANAALPTEFQHDLPVRESRLSPRSWSRMAWNELGLLAAIVVLMAALTASTGGGFLQIGSLVGLFESAAVRSILALGAAAVILSGGIDISIGSLLALSAAVGGLVLKLPYAPAVVIPLGILVGLIVGIAGGCVNAGVSLVGRIHPIVVTLGTMTVYRGLMILATGGNVLTDLPNEFCALATGELWGVRGTLVLLAVSVTGTHVFLKYHREGRHLFAFGSSESAARLAGISRTKVWLIAFGLGGLASGVAGLLELAINRSMQSVLGTGYELRAIAAAVIGGTAITGGRGSAMGVFLGALLLALVEKSLVIWQVSQYRNDVVIGGLLLLAILVDWLLRGGRK
ncbi:MAG: ATP-binding cassette domain-containing protein [Planctomycetota bacterium]